MHDILSRNVCHGCFQYRLTFRSTIRLRGEFSSFNANFCSTCRMDGILSKYVAPVRLATRSVREMKGHKVRIPNTEPTIGRQKVKRFHGEYKTFDPEST